MWESKCEVLSERRFLKYRVTLDSSPVYYSEVLRRWRSDPEFRVFFNALLANCPFQAFRWETPPIAIATAHRPFEFVLVDSPELIREANSSAFSSHFEAVPLKQLVLEFQNLGGDATLVVPRPQSDPSIYGHIASFVRAAPESQRHELLELVGTAMEGCLNTQPVWLSTAGAGVPWLHVRLDNRPKYYQYGPYRSQL